jgi:hypothetical protein
MFLFHMTLPIHNTFKGTSMLFTKQNTCTQTNDAYRNNGTYKLTCKTCDKLYIGQTGRSLRARFSKHNRYKYSHPRYTDFDKIMLKRNMTQ